MSYFTVKTESRGRTFHEHIEAVDSFAATDIALKRNPSAYMAQVVREIDRAEFERLTNTTQV